MSEPSHKYSTIVEQYREENVVFFTFLFFLFQSINVNNSDIPVCQTLLNNYKLSRHGFK